ncbi:MAG: FRG domain-containing protein [Chitinophagaceae bacterium]|nr:FRG domain-containing protein [Chitinophagaceae bacterium]
MPAKRKSNYKTARTRKALKRKSEYGNASVISRHNPGERGLSKKPASKNDSLEIDKDEIENTAITSLEAYFGILEKYCDLDDILFRGQRSDWPLLPKLARIKARGENILESETEMIYDFKRLSKPHLTVIPVNDWEWLAVAQHHGMATRLLDWSTNPLAALWFAVSQPAMSEYGVVWIFFLDKGSYLKSDELTRANPFTENKTKVFQPELSAPRIHVQSGWFTTQEVDGRTNKFIAFDEIGKYRNKLLKLKIPKGSFASLRYQLDRLALNKSTLFPDVDGTAAYIEWKHSMIEDETEV